MGSGLRYNRRDVGHLAYYNHAGHTCSYRVGYISSFSSLACMSRGTCLLKSLYINKCSVLVFVIELLLNRFCHFVSVSMGMRMASRWRCERIQGEFVLLLFLNLNRTTSVASISVSIVFYNNGESPVIAVLPTE